MEKEDKQADIYNSLAIAIFMFINIIIYTIFQP